VHPALSAGNQARRDPARAGLDHRRDAAAVDAATAGDPPSSSGDLHRQGIVLSNELLLVHAYLVGSLLRRLDVNGLAAAHR
jgi:hypothetical protein